ncbi:MAG TPA: DsbA family protein, partial [Myxococcota bacterium]|nr:DsbA family protein [Myxococcota bacterium]
MRLCLTVQGPMRVLLTHALFGANFAEGRDISDRSVLADICLEVGLDPALATRRIDEPDIKAALRSNTEAALADGVFGVPSFVHIEGEHRTLFWGQDRLPLLSRMLNVRDETVVRSRFTARQAPQTLEFFYDFVSPYSYLAATQVEALAARHGATVRWRPMFLGGLLKSVGTEGVPLFSAPPPKQRYVVRDMGDWADYYHVPWRWPSTFPLKTLLPLRLALAVDASLIAPLSLALFRAYWQADRDISAPEVVMDVARQAGVSGALVKRVIDGDPAAKDALTANTAEAAQAGLFGAPSFRVRGHVFWGQDRLPLVERTLAGWEPPTQGAGAASGSLS